MPTIAITSGATVAIAIGIEVRAGVAFEAVTAVARVISRAVVAEAIAISRAMAGEASIASTSTTAKH